LKRPLPLLITSIYPPGHHCQHFRSRSKPHQMSTVILIQLKVSIINIQNSLISGRHAFLRSLRSQNLNQQLQSSRRLLMDNVHTSERPVFRSHFDMICIHLKVLHTK
jgi:hypothetical protein